MNFPFRHLGMAMLLSASGHVFSEPLKMTVTGDNREKVELETMSPTPDIPNADALPFSLDGGQSALKGPLAPLSVAEAAKMTTPTELHSDGPLLIPHPPFIVHAISKDQPTDALWEFRIVDENNKTWMHQEGTGTPPTLFTWDGTQDQKFILDPNRTYYSNFASSSSTKGLVTTPGEATRFVMLAHQDEKDLRFEFGARLYVPEEARFSEEGKFYLADLIRYLENNTGAWSLTLREPENSNFPNLGEDRRALWKAFLEHELKRSFIEERFALTILSEGESSGRVVMRNTAPPEIAPLMQGAAEVASAMEPIDSLIQIKEVKNVVMVELRHDRLFRPGSAYVRDEALAQLTQALKNLPKNKKLLLRSYTRKPHKGEKEREEDPRLAAMRSKVLFSLFAERGLLNDVKNP